MNATFHYIFNLVVAFIVSMLLMWLLELSAKETIILIGLLLIVYNQHAIMAKQEALSNGS